MDTKRKKNTVFVIGFIIGFATGMTMHNHALAVAFGIMLGLVMREIYD